MRLISPLPRQLAVSRLKANLFLLFLALLVRTVFTPYTTVRRGIEQLGDEFWQRGLVRKGFWTAETLIMAVMAWNILESSINLYYPSLLPPAQAAPQPTAGLVLTPARMSSPLTRPSTSPAPSPFNHNTPLRSVARIPQSSSSQNLSTPTQSRQSGRASPLSSSTMKTLNLTPEAPSSTGLFYSPDDRASPVKLAQGQRQSEQPTQASAGYGGQSGASASTATATAASGKVGGDFVLVEREDKEWIDNVRRGVRARGRASEL